MLFPSRPSTSRNSASEGGLSSIPHSVAGAALRICAAVFDARSSPIDSRSVIQKSLTADSGVSNLPGSWMLSDSTLGCGPFHVAARPADSGCLLAKWLDLILWYRVEKV